MTIVICERGGMTWVRTLWANGNLRTGFGYDDAGDADRFARREAQHFNIPVLIRVKPARSVA